MRIIDADRAKEIAEVSLGDIFLQTAVKLLIDKIPTVDAVPVVHGRWVQGYPIACSVCGGAAATDYEDANRYEAWLTPYCPNCGAKMDGDRNA